MEAGPEVRHFQRPRAGQFFWLYNLQGQLLAQVSPTWKLISLSSEEVKWWSEVLNQTQNDPFSRMVTWLFSHFRLSFLFGSHILLVLVSCDLLCHKWLRILKFTKTVI